jgi:predicted Na+-dependent transporter
MEAGILVLFAVVGSGILALVCLAAWIWALVDILKHDFSGLNKLIWLILVLTLPLVGVILYYFIGREQKLPSNT